MGRSRPGGGHSERSFVEAPTRSARGLSSGLCFPKSHLGPRQARRRPVTAAGTGFSGGCWKRPQAAMQGVWGPVWSHAGLLTPTGGGPGPQQEPHALYPALTGDKGTQSTAADVLGPAEAAGPDPINHSPRADRPGPLNPCRRGSREYKLASAASQAFSLCRVGCCWQNRPTLFSVAMTVSLVHPVKPNTGALCCPRRWCD